MKNVPKLVLFSSQNFLLLKEIAKKQKEQKY